MIRLPGACAVAVLALLVVSLSGCQGGSDLSTVNAGGVVTFQSQPVPSAVVTFMPQPGANKDKPMKSASGTTDAQGRFVLGTNQPGDGAVAGKYVVTVGSDDANKPLPGKAPADLTLEVKPEGNDFTIELTP